METTNQKPNSSSHGAQLPASGGSPQYRIQMETGKGLSFSATVSQGCPSEVMDALKELADAAYKDAMKEKMENV